MIPYARQVIDGRDAQAVAEALRSAWLTTGPRVAEFERQVAATVGAAHGVAVSSGTAALHCAMHALGLGPGDEVIVPPMTFAATANAVLYTGALPVFADVEEQTLLLDPRQVEARITPATRAVVSVDYAGQPGRYAELRELARSRGLAFVSDACHALGAEDGAGKVGSLADMSVFSFHPAKHITCGEGGMVTLDDPGLAERMRSFRSHGIDADPHKRAKAATWVYEMNELGFNYRLTDLQCALGLSQLARLPEFLEVRRRMARLYDEALAGQDLIRPLGCRPGVRHAYHLYVVRIDFSRAGVSREAAYRFLLDQGVGVNVHYIPVHLHPYYRRRLGTAEGLCPVAERAYEEILSLPMHAALTEADVARVLDALGRALRPGAAS